MPDLEEYLRNELRKTIRPIDTGEAAALVDHRRARRHVVRRVQAAALAVVVLAGTAGGFVFLSDAFRDGTRNVGGERSPFAIVPMSNGVIAAALQTAAGRLELVSVNPDGSDQHVIRTSTSGDPWLASWSPDGTKLAVATSPPGLGPLAIWVMNADGSNAVKIAEATNVYQPSWSPDGTRIAYPADSSGGAAIHIVNADGTGDRVIGDRLQQQHYYSASFSPDGAQILYDAGTDSTFDIFVMTIDGTSAQQLTDSGTDYSPSWSPDGSQVAFSRLGHDGGSDIYVMDADGSSVRRLTDGGADVTNRNPTWSPDGTRIAYRASAVIDGPGALVVMNADGSHPVTILDADVFGFSWQPLPVTATPAHADPGLGFAVCNVESLQADFNDDGIVDTAWTATKAPDVGPCPTFDGSFTVVAVDVTGDGVADGSAGPLQHCVICHPLASVDLDGDGVRELVVVEQSASVTQYALFSIHPERADTGQALEPVTVASPGDPDAGFRVGEPFTFWAGGDEGYASYVQCADSPSDLIITQTTHPVEGPGSDIRRVQYDELRLGDGRMHVIGRNDRKETTTTPFDGWTGPACGVDFYP
jgi:hypothetical protein